VLRSAVLTKPRRLLRLALLAHARATWAAFQLAYRDLRTDSVRGRAGNICGKEGKEWRSALFTKQLVAAAGCAM
jgi:hypothetical protein